MKWRRFKLFRTGLWDVGNMIIMMQPRWNRLTAVGGYSWTELPIKEVVLFVGIQILITLELVDRVWWVFRLQQPCNWQLNTSAAKIDRKIVTQGEKLNESSVPTMLVSKEGVETENILSQAYVIPGKEEDREQNAHAMARIGDTLLV